VFEGSIYFCVNKVWYVCPS